MEDLEDDSHRRPSRLRVTGKPLYRNAKEVNGPYSKNVYWLATGWEGLNILNPQGLLCPAYPTIPSRGPRRNL